MQLSELGCRGYNKNAQTSRQQQRGSRAPPIESLAFYSRATALCYSTESNNKGLTNWWKVNGEYYFCLELIGFAFALCSSPVARSMQLFWMSGRIHIMTYSVER